MGKLIWFDDCGGGTTFLHLNILKPDLFGSYTKFLLNETIPFHVWQVCYINSKQKSFLGEKSLGEIYIGSQRLANIQDGYEDQRKYCSYYYSMWHLECEWKQN